MKQSHLSDTQIQHYALKTDHDPRVVEHIRQCESCHTKAREYTYLFRAFAQQPVPAFDFNLSELVMKQVEKPKSEPASPKLIMGTIGLLSVVFLGAAIFFFGRQVLTLFTGSSPILVYTIVTCVSALTIILIIENYLEYQQKRRQLTFN